MTNEYRTLITSAVEEFPDRVSAYEDYFLDEVWPQLTAKTSPQAELAEFDSWPQEKWDSLPPKIWTRLSQRALTLRESEQKRSLADFEKQQYLMEQAFRPQLQPFGVNPLQSIDLGLEEPLPRNVA